MARIAGVDIPREKRLEISLTYIYGIGKPTAQKIADDLGLDGGKPGVERLDEPAHWLPHLSLIDVPVGLEPGPLVVPL